MSDEVETIENTLEKLEAKVKARRVSLDKNAWEKRNSCERCAVDVGFAPDARVKMVGGIDATLCHACIREWDIDEIVRHNLTEYNAHKMVMNAYMHAGNAVSTEACFRQAMEHEDTLRAYALMWLAAGVPEPVEAMP